VDEALEFKFLFDFRVKLLKDSGEFESSEPKETNHCEKHPSDRKNSPEWKANNGCNGNESNIHAKKDKHGLKIALFHILDVPDESRDRSPF
jgi:hypothetical protein